MPTARFLLIFCKILLLRVILLDLSVCSYNIFRFSVDWNKGLEIVDLFVLRPWGFVFVFVFFVFLLLRKDGKVLEIRDREIIVHALFLIFFFFLVVVSGSGKFYSTQLISWIQLDWVWGFYGSE